MSCSISQRTLVEEIPNASTNLDEINEAHSGLKLTGAEAQFSAQIEAIRRELAPATGVEAMIVDQMILALSRMRRAAIVEESGAELSEWLGLATLAEESFFRAFRALQTLRSQRKPHWGRAVVAPTPVGDTSDLPPLPCEGWPASPPEIAEELEECVEPLGIDETPSDWRSRLIFDANLSESSPVVKGTWVTVGQIVSLVVDGWTWSDILRSHPELCEDDIRACLTYTVEEEGPIQFC